MFRFLLRAVSAGLLALAVADLLFILPLQAHAKRVASSSAPPVAGTYVPGELLVKYKPGAVAAEPTSQAVGNGFRAVKTIAGQGILVVRLPADTQVEQAIGIFRQDPLVEYAEPNYYRYLSRTPSDTLYPDLWGMPKIKAPEAWDIVFDCRPVVVAVVDSGADYEHPDLAANIWNNSGEVAGNGLDDDGNGYVDDAAGWDFVFRDGKPFDADGHGTHVTGTLAAVGNNARGGAGVCWDAQVMVLRAFDATGVGAVADIIEAMHYARLNGARVVNASYTGTTFSQAERDAVGALDAAGVLLVAAAGNESADNDTAPSYPAGYGAANIIAVAATDRSDNLAWFSNFGARTVHVGAPGVEIKSTCLNGVDPFSENFELDPVGWRLDPPIGRMEDGYNSVWSLADSPAGDYENGIDISAASPAFDLSGSRSTRLEFLLKGRMDPGDRLWVETAEGPMGPWTARRVWVQSLFSGAWTPFDAGVYGSFMFAWRQAEVDLSDLDGVPQAYFRLRFQTDEDGVVADGYRIDQIAVSGLELGSEFYRSLSGTSIAAPQVSGLAALIWAQDPGLTLDQTRARILDGVDRLCGLSGKVITAGRINAFNSLRSVPAVPSGFGAEAFLNRIGLSWDDNYFGIEGFVLERSDGGAGPFVEIARLGPHTFAYQDFGVVASATYVYRLRAIKNGTESDFAEVSAAALTTSSSSGGGGGGGGGLCFITSAWR